MVSESSNAPGVPAGHLIWLADLAAADAERAGSKAATLGELARAGFSVPDGFVLTVNACQHFLKSNGLDRTSPGEVVAAAEMSADLAQALWSAAERLGGPLAVRSSALAEDLGEASFAGQYETVLNVRGPEALLAAVRRCWASACSERVAAYGKVKGQDSPGMAVLVQRMVSAAAAGVAFTANPVTGDRAETLVSAVRGLGERLVSGEVNPDEWVVRGDQAVCGRAPEGAIAADQARAVAGLARRVEAYFGGIPQDVEWGLADGELFLLQARPITALPEPVEWRAPLPGAWARHFRLGEWLGDPVTPLFESWLLTRLEGRLHANYQQIAGVPPPDPIHVVVNGWYFYWLNFLPPTPLGIAWLMLRHVLPKLLVQPRRVAMMFPFTARFGVELFVREWQGTLLPRYRDLVKTGVGNVDRLAPGDLVSLIDQLADAAGDYFTSITLVTGFAWKAELPLAAFYHEHLSPRIGGSHQRLLCGLSDPSVAAPAHAVESLDWFHPTRGEREPRLGGAHVQVRADRRARIVADRQAAEAEARAVLAAEPKLLARFEKLLAMAQRFAPTREEQVASFTLGWPLMRRALHRVGVHLRERGVIAADDDVFFLTRVELLTALNAGDEPSALSSAVARRRQAWQHQRRHRAPLVLGELSPMVKQMFDEMEAVFRPDRPATNGGVRGLPASPGRAMGPVRVVHAPEELDRLQPGDVLVAPATTPGWTPVFARAAAVVTDTGSPVAHASLVAREYGIPAVVGTGDATARLRDGQLVTVDGNIGLVELRP